MRFMVGPSSTNADRDDQVAHIHVVVVGRVREGAVQHLGPARWRLGRELQHGLRLSSAAHG
jgi:hypothetical protein